jgi:hypothetical protein
VSRDCVTQLPGSIAKPNNGWSDPLIVGPLLGRIIRHDGEILRPLTVLDFIEALGAYAALEQLTYGCCAARHSPCKSPSVNDPQFLWREHDLKPLAPVEFTHVPLREPSTKTVNNAKSPK